MTIKVKFYFDSFHRELRKIRSSPLEFLKQIGELSKSGLPYLAIGDDKLGFWVNLQKALFIEVVEET